MNDTAKHSLLFVRKIQYASDATSIYFTDNSDSIRVMNIIFYAIFKLCTTKHLFNFNSVVHFRIFCPLDGSLWIYLSLSACLQIRSNVIIVYVNMMKIGLM